MSENSSEMKRTMVLLGINLDGTYGLRFSLYLLVLPLLTFSSMSYVFYNWDDLGKRMDGIKGVVLYFLVQSYVLVLQYNWNNITMLLDILEERFYEFPFSARNERLRLEKRLTCKMNQLTKVWRYIMDSILVMIIIPPIVVLLLHIIKDGVRDLKINTLHLPLVFHYPRGFETVPMYIATLTLQIFFFFQATRTGILVAVLPFISTQRIVGDLQLLKLAVNELNNILLCNLYDLNHPKRITMKWLNHQGISSFIDTIETRTNCFVKYVVKHQQYIYRKADDVCRGIQHVSFIVETGISALVCTSIYRLAQGEELIVKIQEAFFTIALIYSLFCYHAMGEEVTTKDENVRQALYQVSWVNKPKKFRKSIYVIMTRMLRNLEIKRNGVFILNLQHFVLTVRAAYSLYNIVNNLTH